MLSTASTSHRYFLPTFAAAVLVSISLVPAASAQVLTTKLSNTAPTTNVQISNTAAPGDNGAGQAPGNDAVSGHAGARADRGQTFTVGSKGFKLGAITLQVAGMQPAASEAGVVLKIYSYASNDTATPKSTVATFTGKLPALTEGDTAHYVANPTYLTFNIPPTSLAGGGVYGFSLSFAKQGVAEEDINFYVTYGDSYSGGVQTAYDGKNHTATANDFTNFYIQSAP